MEPHWRWCPTPKVGRWVGLGRELSSWGPVRGEVIYTSDEETSVWVACLMDGINWFFNEFSVHFFAKSLLFYADLLVECLTGWLID